jgi:hypothetical protein
MLMLSVVTQSSIDNNISQIFSHFQRQKLLHNSPTSFATFRKTIRVYTTKSCSKDIFLRRLEKFHNDELNVLKNSLNIIKIIKRRKFT